MAKMTGFKVFRGTKDAFITSGKAEANVDAIVFITGGDDANGSCIYAQGTYFANFAEFISTVNFVKGIKVGDDSYNAAQGGGYLAFGAKDPATVAVNAGSNGIEIGLTDEFVTKVNDTFTKLGSESDEANEAGSAFARIANLAALVSDLTGGSTGSIEGQITAAINALRTEITGDLTDATDAKTLETINDELNDLQSNYLKAADQVVKSVSTEASHGVAVTHNAEGALGVSVIPGSVSENNTSVVTGGAVYTAIEAVKADAKSYTLSAVVGDELAALGANVKEAYKLVDEDSTKVGDYIKIYKDSSLISVELTAEDSLGNLGQYLKYTYVKADGETEIVYLNVSDLLVEAEFKNGLEVNEAGEVSVKVDAASEEFLTVGADGVKLSGVQDAINAAKADLEAIIVENEEVTANALTDLDTRVVDLENRKNAIDSALQEHDITTGSVNGAISVKGTDVSVAGLGSAAFTDAEAYDVAGAAAEVLGSEEDSAEAATVYGVKAYAESLFMWEEL